MGVNLGLGLRQTTGLVMTQSMRQAIEMLQLSTIELVQSINQELLENPLLELEDDINQEADFDESDIDFDQLAAPDSSENDFEIEETAALEGEGEYQDYDTPTDRVNVLERIVEQHESLAEHLLSQINVITNLPVKHSLLENIVTMLDDNGFLPEDPETLARLWSFPRTEIEIAIDFISELEPIGCALGSVEHTLLRQSEILYPRNKLLHLVLKNYFSDLQKLQYQRIAQQLSVEVDQIYALSELLHSLNPFPGLKYSKSRSSYIQPDIEVRLIDGEVIVTLLDNWVPRLKINQYYLDLLKKKGSNPELKDYIRDKYSSAKYLIKNISTRRETIMKITKAIMDEQYLFLKKGPGNLLPLVYSTIASKIEMHESTVSRVCTNKYVQCEWGIFELKYFFVSHIKTTNAELFSSDQIMSKLKEIIEQEDPNDPLSDEKIVELLEKEGITVARRTVAKYRGILDIPTSSLRKKIYFLKKC